MPKGILYVESRPASPEQAADYHQWYNETHLPEMLSVDGFVSARRFEPVEGDGPFIAIYEFDTDDLDTTSKARGRHQIRTQLHSGRGRPTRRRWCAISWRSRPSPRTGD